MLDLVCEGPRHPRAWISLSFTENITPTPSHFLSLVLAFSVIIQTIKIRSNGNNVSHASLTSPFPANGLPAHLNSLRCLAMVLLASTYVVYDRILRWIMKIRTHVAGQPLLDKRKSAHVVNGDFQWWSRLICGTYVHCAHSFNGVVGLNYTWGT